MICISEYPSSLGPHLSAFWPASLFIRQFAWGLDFVSNLVIQNAHDCLALALYDLSHVQGRAWHNEASLWKVCLHGFIGVNSSEHYQVKDQAQVRIVRLEVQWLGEIRVFLYVHGNVIRLKFKGFCTYHIAIGCWMQLTLCQAYHHYQNFSSIHWLRKESRLKIEHEIRIILPLLGLVVWYVSDCSSWNKTWHSCTNTHLYRPGWFW